MNIIQVLTQVISQVWWLLLILIIVGLLKTSFVKGILGEFFVNQSARLFLDKEKYHLMKNVTLPTEDGSTQIDHVIVSKYGSASIGVRSSKSGSYFELFKDLNEM